MKDRETPPLRKNARLGPRSVDTAYDRALQRVEREATEVAKSLAAMTGMDPQIAGLMVRRFGYLPIRNFLDDLHDA